MKKNKHPKDDGMTDYAKLVYGRNFVPVKPRRKLCRSFYCYSFVIGMITGVFIVVLGELGAFKWLFAG